MLPHIPNPRILVADRFHLLPTGLRQLPLRFLAPFRKVDIQAAAECALKFEVESVLALLQSRAFGSMFRQMGESAFETLGKGVIFLFLGGSFYVALEYASVEFQELFEDGQEAETRRPFGLFLEQSVEVGAYG